MEERPMEVRPVVTYLIAARGRFVRQEAKDGDFFIALDEVRGRIINAPVGEFSAALKQEAADHCLPMLVMNEARTEVYAGFHGGLYEEPPTPELLEHFQRFLRPIQRDYLRRTVAAGVPASAAAPASA